MHRSIAKTIFNALLSRNVLALTLEERKHVAAASGLGPLYLPSSAILGSAITAASKSKQARAESRAFNAVNAAVKAAAAKHQA